MVAKCAEIDARENLTRNEKIAAKVAAGMTLQAIGEQHGITRERVRQIVKQRPRAAAEAAMPRAGASLRNPEAIAMSKNAKNHPGRLQAVMECLNPDYGKHGGQAKFAADIGISYANFNAIMRGSPLSKKVADAIFHQFQEEGVTLSFLYFGLAGRGMKPEFEQKLLEWQHQNDKKIFSSDDEVFHQISLPHNAPKTKAKTAVEVDPIARLQEPVDTVRRVMIEETEPTMRSALAVAALGVVITKAQELIAEFEDEANPSGGSR